MSGNAESPRQARWLLLGSLVVHFCAVVFSRGFQHLDEHFQIIEYVSTKIGWTDPATLPWEYAKQMRPWLQPFFYTGITKFLLSCGIDSPPALNQFLRAATSLLGWLSLVALYDLFKKQGTRLALCLSVFCFLPYFHTRTTAENFGTSLFVFALWFLLQERTFSWLPQTLLTGISGALLGLAFHARYQLAFSLMGLAVWCVFVARLKRRRLALLSIGLVTGLLLGIGIDRWGYGTWTLAPWNYFRVNLLEGAASKFGVDPWWGYLDFLVRYTPVYAGVLVGFLAAYFMISPVGRRHVISWILLPFLLGHFAIGHKEPRFLYPFYVYLPVIASVLWRQFSPFLQPPPHLDGLKTPAGSQVGAKKWNPLSRLTIRVLKAGVFALFLLNLGALLFYTFRREKPQFVLNEYLSENFRGTLHLTGLEGDPFDLDPFYQHFYRPRDFHFYRLPSTAFGPQVASGQDSGSNLARSNGNVSSSLAGRLRTLLAQIGESNPASTANSSVRPPLHFYLHKKGIESDGDNPDPRICVKTYELLPSWISKRGLKYWARKINNTLVYRCALERSESG